MLIPLLAALVQSPPQAPPPSVSIPRIDTVITVDGRLDEPVWAKAARLEGFHQYRPVDGRPAEQETILLVWYSPTAIHIGVIGNDTDPGSIRATFTDRDKIDGEDRVRIYLDTFNDKRRAAFFGVNGLGVQEDGLRSETGANAGSLFGGQDDLNVDFLWDSKGQLTDHGYEVEIRIPFKSLQYGGSGPQTWGFNATRYVMRSGFQDTWTDVRRANSSFLAQEGSITGLQELQRGVVFEAQPFVTASWDGSRDPSTGEFSRQDPSPSAGINLQVATTSLAFDGTVNPDFSQVESDAGLITVNERFALFLPEKRPFFLKGIDLFTTPGQLIYTRRIANPIGGAKLSGKMGRNSIAYLGAVDELPDQNALFNVLRVRRDLGTTSVAGITYTDRIQGQAYNRLLEGDAHIVFATLYFVEAQYGQSWTNLDDGRATATDPIWKLTFDRTGRTWGFNYSINGIGTDFVAGAGFVPRTDIVTAHVFNRLSFYGAKGALLENFTTFFGPTWVYGYQDFTHSAPLEGNEEVTLQFQLRGGWQLSNVVQRDYTTFDPESYAGIETSPGNPFAPPPTLDNLFTNKFSVTTPTYQKFNASASLAFGEVPLYAEGSEGRGTSISATLNLRPTTTLRLEGNLAYQHLTRASDGSEFANSIIPRFKVEFQPSVPLFFRVIAEYQSTRRAALRDPVTGQILLVGGLPSTDLNTGGLAVSWLASYEPSPGTVAFLGYGSTSTTDSAFDFSTLQRQADGFFVKLAYLYRR